MKKERMSEDMRAARDKAAKIGSWAYSSYVYVPSVPHVDSKKPLRKRESVPLEDHDVVPGK